MRGLLSTLLIVLATRGAFAADPSVTAIAFAPEGQRVVVGTQAGVKVLGWPDLKTTSTLETDLPHVHAIRFSPSGRLVAVAGGSPAEEGRVDIFSWPDGKRVAQLGEHDDVVMDVTWRDDALLATASIDRRIQLWDLPERRLVRSLTGHSRGVTCVTFLGPTQLLSGSLDQTLRLWDTESGNIVRTLNNHRLAVNALALRPGEAALPMIASASADKTVRLWQPTIGRMVRFVKLPARPLAVAWHPDGSRLVAACSDGKVREIDPDTADIMAEHPVLSGWIYAIAVHANSGTILAGGSGGKLVSRPAGR